MSLITLRRAWCATIAAIFSTSGAHAADAPDKGRCADAYENAQRLEKSGKLVEALDEASLCANDACPAVLRSECVGWLSPLRARQSSLVVEARDGGGADLVDVRVSVDGALVQPRLEGRAFVVNPGRRSVRFDYGSKTETMELVVREGEQGRRLVVRFETKPVAAAPVPVAPKPRTLGWIFGGVGVLALGSFGYFGLSGKSLDNELERECAPRCSSDRVDHVRTQYIVADVSLGVGLVSLALATYFFLAPERR